MFTVISTLKTLRRSLLAFCLSGAGASAALSSVCTYSPIGASVGNVFTKDYLFLNLDGWQDHNLGPASDPRVKLYYATIVHALQVGARITILYNNSKVCSDTDNDWQDIQYIRATR